MKSEKTPRDGTKPKPVKKIEVSERHIKLRAVLVVLFILIALAAFAWAIISALSTDKGWHTVEVSSSEVNCSSEFSFYYYIEEGGLSATEELENVETLYALACIDAYRLFNEFTLYEDLYNLAYINDNPNTEVSVDERLYSALQLVQQYNMLPMLYLGPVYVIYDGIMYASNELDAQYSDPYYNDETAAYIDEIMDYVNDGDVSLQLLGDNRVKLNVSPEYLAFMEEFTQSDDDEEAVARYLNFGVLRNAFIADFIADYLIENGCASGILNSYDGYTRSLGEGDEFSITIYNKGESATYPAGTANGTGAASVVRFRSYALSSSDYGYKFGYSDGATATLYIDPSDGLYKSCIDDLIVYSYSSSCAEVLLQAYNIYIAAQFDSSAMQATGLNYIYCEGTDILYNDGSAEVIANSFNDGTEYTAVKV